MKKNSVIAGLAVLNLILMAALTYVWVKWRGEIPSDATVAAPTPPAGAQAQEFTFRAPGRFVGDDAPLIVNEIPNDFGGTIEIVSLKATP